MKAIADIIKELRAEKGMSQQQLADALCVKRYTLSNWEQGRTEPDLDAIRLLSRYFGVTADYLLGLED